MTGTKVDELIASIPLLDIDLGDIFNFKKQCIDTLAKEIIGSTLDYALETSLRRMESVAKINPRIRQDAINNVLPAVKSLAVAIRNAPECDAETLANAPFVQPKSKTNAPRKPRTPKTAEPETNVAATATVADAKGITAVTTSPVEAKTAEKPKDALTTVTDAVKKGTRRKTVQGLSGVSTPTGESPIAGVTGKKASSAAGGDIVEVGKQFTIAFDGTERKYHIVAPQFFRNNNQIESDPSVIPIADTSALAQLVTGSKKGDSIDPATFGIAVPLSGEITKVQIKEVTAPTLIFTGPLGPVLVDQTKEDWNKVKDAPAEPLNRPVEVDDTTLKDIGVNKVTPVSKFENEPEEGGEGL
jgi:hypothetical protein